MMSNSDSAERRIQYYALFEPTEVLEDGRWNPEAQVLVDAIPVPTAEALAGVEGMPRSIDFLLGSVPAGSVPVQWQSDAAWHLITLTGTPTEDAIPMSTAVLGPNAEGQDLTLFLTIQNMSSHDVSITGKIGTFLAGKEAAPGTIEELLDRIDAESIHGVAIYDVGQASFSALVDELEHPHLFFDIGRPLGFNAYTRPMLPAFDPLVFAPSDTYPQPIILSHLDQDHWLFAVQSGAAVWDPAAGYWKTTPIYRQAALERVWVVRLPLGILYGGSHIHFLLELHSLGILLVWPEACASIQSGDISIWQCTPSVGAPATQRYMKNNTSLALRVDSAHSAAVLCGDADYGSFAPGVFVGVTAVVAPHHGGCIQFGATPNVRGPGRMVLSTYENAYPSVPHDQTIADALNNGWFVTRTDARHSCGRCGNVHGHKYIPLAGTQPECGCGVVTSAQICLPHVQ
ncbi:hypothetical protein [Stenotrophomonas sp. SMYL8]|uniref:hypothetical protein n=1 Tax=Stenotrophomonas sp. SMYL8 TaxID=3076041 RepID=UPI000F158AFA|nr:hypothetical protein [Stenotrophomonas sp. SMYL8]